MHGKPCGAANLRTDRRMTFRTTRPAGPRHAASVLAAGVLLGFLAGCAHPQSSAELEQQQACGQQADRQFEKQNRYLLSERDQTDTPFSSSGLPGNTTEGLNDQYSRDRMVDDCMHSLSGTEPTIRPATP